MDEEELQKRLTDCVYFLASPLTCKKGIECEYRHSEIARLNPRDCWYWLGGCCFNPDCAFRHPPLEGLKEAYYESSNLNNPPALPTEKTNIPCYFYSKGFCNKGEKCSFLHGSADVSHALNLKPSKPPSMVNNPIPSDKKSSEESKTGSPPLKPHPNPSENAQIDHTITMRKPTQDPQQEETTQDSEQEETTEDSDSDSDSDSEQEERIESPDLSNSLDLQEEFVQSESDVFNDQSSGFDVVVEGEQERLGYEQDVDFFDHEEDPIEYDPPPPPPPAYPIELGNGFVKERFNVYDRLDKVQSRTSIFYRLSFKKRSFQSQPIFNGRKGHQDLREHLKRRKVAVDEGIQHCFSQGHNRNFRRHSHPQRKAAVPVNRSSRKPHAMQQKRRFFKGKNSVFNGPKSLGEIKEEKKNGFQGKDGFQGPRPLSEILKNKRKLG